ncbi:thiamine phosphate synthase [Flexivirga meconopsidis]|uniref:thiamine phosphate synthase n=1 Tax=Flexivirga meconopsidis TaxID=2977121 RepID=UPI00223E90A2|nr:thiamine phosphate synthase [Flexivirga meconopsidis]
MTSVPTLLLVTDRTQTGGRPLVDVLAACAHGGIRHILLRERDLPEPAYQDLLGAVLDRIGDRATVLARSPSAGVRGCHLSASMPLPAPRPEIVGRSVHGPGELRRAAVEGVDYVLAGPYAGSKSKPGYGPALGPRGIEALVRTGCAPPVVAIGGVLPADAPTLAASGAHGMAVMGPLMRAADPSTLAAEYAYAATAFAQKPQNEEIA